MDVRNVKVLKPGDSVFREICLIKVEADESARESLITIANVFRANIVDVTENSLIVELTGNQSKIEAFLKILDGYEILELARTGITGLGRGVENVTYL